MNAAMIATLVCTHVIVGCAVALVCLHFHKRTIEEWGETIEAWQGTVDKWGGSIDLCNELLDHNKQLLADWKASDKRLIVAFQTTLDAERAARYVSTTPVRQM